MEYRKFGGVIVARLDPGEEILEQVRQIALSEQIKLAHIQALGAVSDFTVGVFDVEKKAYRADEFYCHLHMSAGNESGAVFGGHLNRAVISATCEMIITLIDGRVGRRRDEQIGLNLFEF